MNSRQKRFLIFPRANPTRHQVSLSQNIVKMQSFEFSCCSLRQFVAGIGVPVDVGAEAMTIGYVFKAQYFLPYNVSQLKPTQLRLERDVEHDEYGQVDDDDDDEDGPRGSDDEVRWVIYKGLESILDSNRIDGKQCVMRAICEASRLPFTHESGLLGEILHILFV